MYNENEWSPEQEAEIARLMKEHNLKRIQAIQKMQRTKHEKEAREKIFGRRR